MNNLIKQLELLESFMNEDYLMQEEGTGFKLFSRNMLTEDDEQLEVITLDIIDSDENEIITRYNVDLECAEDIETLATGLISEIYEQDINYRNRSIKNFKGKYLNSKMQQMIKAIKQNDYIKVATINFEMTEKYKMVEIYRREIQEFKRYVKLLYQAKDYFDEAA